MTAQKNYFTAMKGMAIARKDPELFIRYMSERYDAWIEFPTEECDGSLYWTCGPDYEPLPQSAIEEIKGFMAIYCPQYQFPNLDDGQWHGDAYRGCVSCELPTTDKY